MSMIHGDFGMRTGKPQGEAPALNRGPQKYKGQKELVRVRKHGTRCILGPKGFESL